MLFDFSTLAPQNCYKLMTSTITPRPIAWVTTQDAEGRLNTAPYSFFNAMSGDPPVVALGIGNRPEGGPKDSLANILATRQFVINLVPERMAEAMNVSAIDFPFGVSEAAQAGLATIPSSRVSPPRLAGSPVAFEVELLQAVDIGRGKQVVLGTVLAAHIDDPCVLDAERCHVDTPALGLIGRMHGGGWYARCSDLFELPRIPLNAWNDAHPAREKE